MDFRIKEKSIIVICILFFFCGFDRVWMLFFKFVLVRNKLSCESIYIDVYCFNVLWIVKSDV